MGIKRKDINAILSNEELDGDAKTKALLDLIHGEVDEIRDSYDTLKAELDKAKADLDSANQGKSDAEKALNDFKLETEQKQTIAEKHTLYKNLLKDIGVPDKRIETIMKVTDFNAVTIKDGKLEGAEELTKSLKAEWADFIPVQQQGGANTPKPPANNPTKTYTKEEMRSMSAEEINKNWEAIKASLKT